MWRGRRREDRSSNVYASSGALNAHVSFRYTQAIANAVTSSSSNEWDLYARCLNLIGSQRTKHGIILAGRCRSSTTSSDIQRTRAGSLLRRRPSRALHGSFNNARPGCGVTVSRRRRDARRCVGSSLFSHLIGPIRCLSLLTPITRPNTVGGRIVDSALGLLGRRAHPS
ncbi:hypothetical protein PsYK624_156520 [Phanerochaete sordida]|uniref:Uncharacterized protein n=1 Tax=Phanerochaete sordida TaxID=48140 RepID=A0A9P3GQU4_9APHY|nr:hypothetical protein PsYK624_156520 [Phanerochaete sordida]